MRDRISRRIAAKQKWAESMLSNQTSGSARNLIIGYQPMLFVLSQKNNMLRKSLFFLVAE